MLRVGSSRRCRLRRHLVRPFRGRLGHSLLRSQAFPNHGFLYLFEPSIDEIVDVAIKQLMHSVILSILFDSFAAEHSARMLAMKSASDNAEELEDDLRLSFNKARQASITQEISEIAAGAEAVSA